ncbi:MAG: type II toxin-antitoxin system RelB/DinJ family antitoxin [Fibrobacteres bacterium]|nr:type II toxin-antitoxin system RelB/DinJ family antitoxin [Fibrobacterota bacterium]
MERAAMIRARTEPGVKEKAEAIFEKLGLNATGAINLFYKQVILHNGIPFDVRIPNSTTRKAMADVKAGKVERFKDAESMFKALRS